MLTYTRERIAQWDKVFSKTRQKHRPANYYHRLLEKAYKFLVPRGLRVLELGCGDGSLLAALEPSFGVGIDFSNQAIRTAKSDHPELLLIRADAHSLPLSVTFDVIILSDLLNDVWDAQLIFERISKLMHRRTRLILNTHSRLWQIPLNASETLGLKNRTLLQNWFTVEDIENLFKLTDYELITHSREVLAPVNIPIISWILNNFLVKLWPFDFFALTNLLIARPAQANLRETEPPSVSIIVPARNEAGNIASIFSRTPKLGPSMEIIFVEGHSKDDTFKTIQNEIASNPSQKSSLSKQKGVGKADAVWQGFAAAQNDILMILDADLSVPPEDLSRFYEALVSNKAEFVNGARLVYPMENRAMQPANLIGNKAFSLIFSWLLGQTVKDTLCGTKVIWRADYELLRKNWQPLGTADPFGDFDLLMGASKLNLKIIDLPIRYRERTYGQTNISRWRHGWMLLKISFTGAKRLKFQLGA
jgi:SAM-dependent methyltransferase